MNPCYDATMSSESDKLIKFIATTVEGLRQRIDRITDQMATKVDLANLRDELAALRDEMATKADLAAVKADLAAVKDQMATKLDLVGLESRLRAEMATKNRLRRLETTMHGEFEQVHIRFDSMDRRVDTRIGQIESDVSRLRSVVYLLVKDKPNMLRLLSQPTPENSRPQG
ncbi:MAG: hypothetical protein ACREA9_17595 [Pyrinomonadaceae bacterium]